MGQREGDQRVERQKAVVDPSVCAKWFIDEEAPFYTVDRELLEMFPRIARHVKSLQ